MTVSEPSLREEKLSTKTEIASFLRCTGRTVENLMRKGLPYMKLGNHRVRFKLKEVERWLKERS